MSIQGIIKNIVIKLRFYLFPSQHDKEIKRWLSDGGDEALRFNYDLDKNSLVLDLGGYKGQWSSDIYSRFNCRLLIFEPVSSFAAKIKERFRKNSNIEVFCLALGKNQRQDNIALEENGSSIYLNSAIRETIKFEDVSEFFALHNIESVDLMKINIEGGEYELMDRLLETGLISRIKNIQIQFHDFGPEYSVLMDNICMELSKTHTPTYQYRFVWENWTRVDLLVD